MASNFASLLSLCAVVLFSSSPPPPLPPRAVSPGPATGRSNSKAWSEFLIFRNSSLKSNTLIMWYNYYMASQAFLLPLLVYIGAECWCEMIKMPLITVEGEDFPIKDHLH